MKGPKFNANLVRLNQITDQRLAAVVANLRRSKAPELHEEAVTQVLRPFCRMINNAELENVPPAQLLDFIPLLTASMLMEVTSRSVPKGTPPAVLQSYLQEFIKDITDDCVRVFNDFYGPVFATAEPGDPPATPQGTVN